MIIIGVGCGPGMLTEQAIREISRASLIYGSDRAIELAKSYIPFNCTVKTIDDFKNLDQLAKDAIILSTGDPMLAGLGYLSGEVIPGISSLQVATARLHIPISRVAVVVAHGKGHKKGMRDTVEEVKRGKIVFLLADPKFNVQELYTELSALSEPLKIALCENLGYPEEHILIRDIHSPPQPTEALYSIVIGNF
ncbi:MAG: cobalt-precorrin-7 (C(5))-methyltransferase [Methanoregula sp.]|jgi:cobalt-precorrin-7 (C5)-methyltransferase|nr:cobalt-precorrin-7 (C(5))-methyltransferase [Methanoregula sp.]